ncbi:MAG TPA: hypothetical protein VF473_09685 [Cyclobacteriaceae bacterium]
MMKKLSLIGVAAVAAITCACSSTSNSIQEHTSSFSKADSLTDAYLVLNDSLLQSWNRIVSTEIDKARTLQEIITDLDAASLLSDELRESFEVRMEQLEKIRFTQESIKDPHAVEDYDIAFKSIVDDLTNLTKDDPQNMFGGLISSSSATRLSYDRIANAFNSFVQKNKSMLKEVNTNNELEAKPLFVNIK